MAAPLPQLPRGAVWVGEFDDMDTRVAVSDRFGEGQLSTKAACCQARSGAILDDDGRTSTVDDLAGDDSVAVILGVEPTIRLTPAQARYFARNLLSAAAIADDWRLDSAIARDGAKERQRRGARLVKRPLFLLFLLFGHINAQIMKY